MNETMNTAPVVVVPCADYEPLRVEAALRSCLEPLGGLSWVTPGMTVGIKANLVSAMKPEEAATTHPALLCALVKLLREAGAGRVIIGDSPGGLYTAAFVRHVYDAAGLHACEVFGAELNQNFGTAEARFPEAVVLKSFTYTSWLDECDALIDFCKLKAHGMMGMSAAAKNLFGVIPGTMKPEYHFRFPEMKDFAAMLVDINDYFADKVKLALTDAVEGMEGNGPTAGTPRHIGVLTASVSTHAADVVSAQLIGLTPAEVPTILAAMDRGRITGRLEDIPLILIGAGSLGELTVQDFESVAVRRSHLFQSHGKLTGSIIRRVLDSRPKLKAGECVGCGKCASICPAKAIDIGPGKGKKKIAHIDRDKCIRCFCCQEFCPVGAMKVHRTFIARLLVR